MIEYIKKIKKIISDPLYRFGCLSTIGLYKNMSDRKYLEKKFLLKMGYKINLDNPKTFNEKLQWLKLYDRNPEYTKMVDKYDVKEYVSKIIGEEYIIPTIGVYEKFNNIDFDKLPNQFVMKCTHDSGGIIICKDKKKLDINLARKKINKSLRNNYYYKHREWPYKNVKPRIIIEKYLDDGENSQLNDYKIMCFVGKAKCSFVCSERDNKDLGLAVTFFDLNWKKMPFERHYRSSGKKIKKPENYNKMIKLSEKLSKNIPFVRVDWYEINGKLYFGELTFFPGAGFEEFTPEKWDFRLGEMLKLPGKNLSDIDE